MRRVYKCKCSGVAEAFSYMAQDVPASGVASVGVPQPDGAV